MVNTWIRKRLIQILSAKSIEFSKGWLGVYPEPKVAKGIFQWSQRLFQGQRVEAAAALHVTLAYVAEDGNPIVLPGFDPKRRYQAMISGLELFGPKNDTLVLLLKSPSLQQRFKELKRAGHRSDWPEYRPHITIKEDADQNDLTRAQNYLHQLRTRYPKIMLNNETWNEID